MNLRKETHQTRLKATRLGFTRVCNPLQRDFSSVFSILFAVTFPLGAIANGMPCSIESVQVLSTVVHLQFSETRYWKFKDPEGNEGFIGIGGVTKFIDRGGIVEVVKLGRALSLGDGQEVVLSDNHQSCTIAVDLAGFPKLNINAAFWYPGRKTELKAHVGPLPRRVP